MDNFSSQGGHCMKKRILAGLMTLVMVFSLFPTAAFAVPDDPLTPDAVKSADGKVTLNKTATRTGENEWEVTLSVDTQKEITQQKAEVVFVLDTSGSMAWCTNDAHEHSKNCYTECTYTKNPSHYENDRVWNRYKHIDWGTTCTQGLHLGSGFQMENWYQMTCGETHVHKNGGQACTQVDNQSTDSTKWSRLKQAIKAINDTAADLKKGLGDNVTISYVTFSSRNYSNHLDVYNESTWANAKISAAGGTSLSAGVEKGIAQFDKNSAVKKFLIIVADGAADDKYPTDAVATFKKSTADGGMDGTVYCIGLTAAAAGIADFKNLATDADHYKEAKDGLDMSAFLTNVTKSVVALISDPMGAGVSVTGNAEVKIDNTVSTTPVKNDSNKKLEWTTAKLESGSKVTMTYKVKLDAAPTVGNHTGIKLNNNATLNYAYKDGNSNNKNESLNFPVPEASYKAASLTAVYQLEGGTALTVPNPYNNGETKTLVTDYGTPSFGYTAAPDSVAYSADDTKEYKLVSSKLYTVNGTAETEVTEATDVVAYLNDHTANATVAYKVVNTYRLQDKHQPAPDLSITKEVVGDTTYKVGDDITYKITVTNSGDAAATNVTMKDTLPSQLEFKSAQAVSGVTFDEKTLTWTIANIPAKSGETNGVVELFITVKAVGAGTNVKNTAVIGDNGPSGSDDGVTIKAIYPVTYQFTGAAPSGVSAPVDTNKYAAGETVTVKQLTQTTIQTLTGTWTFNGWESPTNATITNNQFTMPNGDVTITGTWTFKATPALKPETHLHYDANGGYFGTTATTVKQEDNLTSGPHTLNTTAEFIPTHDQQNGHNVLFLGWTTTDTNDKVYERGDTLPTLVTSVTIPTVKAVYAVWGLDAEGGENGGDGTPDVCQAKVTYKIVNGFWSGTDAADKIEYVTLKTKDKNGVWTNAADTTLKNVPSVTGVVAKTGYTTTGASWDTTPVNGTTPAVNDTVYTYTLPGTPILSITKTADKQTVKVGETITYTITVKNTGKAAAEQVKVTDVLPSTLTLVGSTASSVGGDVSLDKDTNTFSWTIAKLAADGTATIRVKAQVKAGTALGTQINNTAYIGDKEKQDTETVTVTDSALTITKSADKQAVVAGEEITYAIEVTNSGNKSATVTITDVLPAELNYVSAYRVDTSGNVDATYDSATRTVTWANVPVPAKNGDVNGEAQLFLMVTVANDVAVGATIKNVATSSDPNVPDSNESTVSVSYNLVIEKKLASNAPDAAKTYDYKFDVICDKETVKTVTITGAGTAQLSLPVGEYTVTEQPVSIPNYTCTASYQAAGTELPETPNAVFVREHDSLAKMTVTNSFAYTGGGGGGGGTTYYYFAIQKVDAQDNHALKGAKFGLYLGSSKLTTATSGKDGYVSFQIDSSDYARIKKSSDKLYYQELTAPEGYVKDNGTYTISYKDFTTTSAKAKEAAKEVLNYRTSTPDLLNDSDHYAYVQGYKDGTVRPNGLISRAETTTIFFRLLTAEVRDGNLKDRNDYTDVSDQYWANTAISTMSDLGIIQGYSNGTFNPTAPITRAQFAAICARFDTKKTSDEPTDFTDTAGHWAEGYIQRAVELGWIKGFNDGSFRPDTYITRAQAMTLINRVLNRIPEDEDDLLSGMTTWPDCKPDAWCYLAVQEATNSHDFKHKSGNYETWTGLNTAPDWSRYEN